MTPSIESTVNPVALWENYDLASSELSFDDEPPLDMRVAATAIERFSSLEVKGNAGATLLTIPKGLRLANLESGAFRMYADSFSDKPVSKTYTILITNGVLKDAKNLSKEELERIVRRTGYKMARTIEVAALCALKKEERPFSRGDYACCEEGTMVGFGPEGFIVNNWQNFGGAAVVQRLN